MPQDFRFLYVPGQAIATGDDETIARIDEAIDRRGGDLDANGAGDATRVGPLRDRHLQLRGRYPARRRPAETFEERSRSWTTSWVPASVTPDHYLHVSATIGGSKPCPATEPEETGLIDPWPGHLG